MTRREDQIKRDIRKTLEEAYIKEGEDTIVKGEWDKTKTIYDNSKLNKK
jgi:hypothetical protein